MSQFTIEHAIGAKKSRFDNDPDHTAKADQDKPTVDRLLRSGDRERDIFQCFVPTITYDRWLEMIECLSFTESAIASDPRCF